MTLAETLESDIAAMLLESDGAVEAGVTLLDGDTFTLQGVFRDATDAVEAYGVQVEASGPTLEVATSELGETVRADIDLVTIGDAAFTVQRIHRTGIGLSVLYLTNA